MEEKKYRLYYCLRFNPHKKIGTVFINTAEPTKHSSYLSLVEMMNRNADIIKVGVDECK